MSLTRDQFLRAWIDSVDPEYARGVLSDPDSAAAIEQLCEQFAAVSAAVEETTQEVHGYPFSGQTDEPAGGASYASVTLALTRTKRLGEVYPVEPGTRFEEVQLDAGPDGPIEVRTGRVFRTTTRTVFLPGESGPHEVEARAERLGRGMNFPLPDTLRGHFAPGKGRGNDGASIAASTSSPHTLTTAPRPDAPVPEHVGQVLAFMSGSNTGQLRRIVGYVAPTPPTDAGGLLLARDVLLRVSGVTGTFQVGETVRISGGGTVGILLAQRGSHALIEARNDVPSVAGGNLGGDLSGATASVVAVEVSEQMTSSVETETWKVVDPVVEFELVSTNAASPTGGRDAVLDSLGWSKLVLRAVAEDDAAYRDRIARSGDKITPGAVERAANRVLAPRGAEVSFREVGTEALPGFYADQDFADLDSVAVAGSPTGWQAGEEVRQDATGATGVALVASPAGVGPLLPPVLVGIGRVRGTFQAGFPIEGQESGQTIALPVFSGGLRLDDTHRTAFEYVDMRAYFLIGFPLRGLGDFGCFFDAGPYGFFDAAPALAFFDGFAATSAALAQRVWQSVDDVRGAGVGFALVEERPV